jgi:SAM-dependent methyltransferase
MAITSIEVLLMRALRDKGVLPLGGDVLEIGEANWYGDAGLGDLQDDIDRFAAPAERAGLTTRLRELVTDKPATLNFDLAKLFWHVFLQPASLTAIDLDGTGHALRHDLNGPVDLGRRFDAVLDFGTLEHVFNLAQALKTIHEHTAPGGLMIHGLPFTGWVDHGFFNFQPTFYWDLAAANGYEVSSLTYAQMTPLKLVRINRREEVAELARAGTFDGNGLIYAVLRQAAEPGPFRIPMQGVYARTVSPEVADAWRTLR